MRLKSIWSRPGASFQCAKTVMVVCGLPARWLLRSRSAPLDTYKTLCAPSRARRAFPRSRTPAAVTVERWPGAATASRGGLVTDRAGLLCGARRPGPWHGPGRPTERARRRALRVDREGQSSGPVHRGLSWRISGAGRATGRATGAGVCGRIPVYLASDHPAGRPGQDGRGCMRACADAPCRWGFKSPLGHRPFAYICGLRECCCAHELPFRVVGEPQAQLAVGSLPCRRARRRAGRR